MVVAHLVFARLEEVGGGKVLSHGVQFIPCGVQRRFHDQQPLGRRVEMRVIRLVFIVFAIDGWLPVAQAAEVADAVYRNGFVYTTSSARISSRLGPRVSSATRRRTSPPASFPSTTTRSGRSGTRRAGSRSTP